MLSRQISMIRQHGLGPLALRSQDANPSSNSHAMSLAMPQHRCMLRLTCKLRLTLKGRSKLLPPFAKVSGSTVLIEDFGRTTGVDLRFSLLSAPAITKAILNDRAVQYVVIAATITSVEKVSMPPDKSDNDRDYFLAHGILNEAQPIGLLDMRPFKDLLSRVVRSGDE
jgi:hypothetical protein